jgi:hypothetical protein
VKIDAGKPVFSGLDKSQYTLLMIIWVQRSHASIGMKMMLMEATGLSKQTVASWFETKNRWAGNTHQAIKWRNNTWHARRTWQVYKANPAAYVAKLENGTIDLEGFKLCNCVRPPPQINDYDNTENYSMQSYISAHSGNTLQFINVGVEIAPGVAPRPQTLPFNFPECSAEEVQTINDSLKKLAKLQRLSDWFQQHMKEGACPEYSQAPTQQLKSHRSTDSDVQLRHLRPLKPRLPADYMTKEGNVSIESSNKVPTGSNSVSSTGDSAHITGDSTHTTSDSAHDTLTTLDYARILLTLDDTTRATNSTNSMVVKEDNGKPKARSRLPDAPVSRKYQVIDTLEENRLRRSTRLSEPMKATTVPGKEGQFSLEQSSEIQKKGAEKDLSVDGVADTSKRRKI